MRRHCWTLICTALLLGACGGTPQPTQQATAPTPAPAIATAAPAATNPPPTAAATARPAATAAPVVPAALEPTAQLILPPTDMPAASTGTPVFRAEPTEAPPAPTPTAPAKAAISEPARLVIEQIGLDYNPVSVGLDKNRVPIVPDHDVGWYNLSAAPGQGDNIVFWGHVLRFRSTPKTPAPFARLKELKPGASVTLYDAEGNRHDYKITQQVWATPDQVQYILPQGQEMITMVSCIGDKVIQDGEVVDESHRLITVAEPA